MSGQSFIFTYMQACFSGKLSFADCGPVWHVGIIAALLVLAVITLIAMRLRGNSQSTTD